MNLPVYGLRIDLHDGRCNGVFVVTVIPRITVNRKPDVVLVEQDVQRVNARSSRGACCEHFFAADLAMSR